MEGKYLLFGIVTIIILSSPVSTTQPFDGNVQDSTGGFIAADDSNVLNPGFETGAFNPWVNVESSTANQIQSSVVHSGSYALQMDSIYFVWAYVDQVFSTPIILSDESRFSAAIYPEDTGITCGAYGRARISLVVNNTETGVARSIIYIWSGYNYPGADTGSNVTRAHYLFYDWNPNEWHVLNREIVSDYSAVFGAPSSPSVLEVTKISLVNHASNGEPGTFYADDIAIVAGEETPWLDGWNYRKSHNIIGSTGAGVDYQTQIVVNYGAGTDSGESVYCSTYCQTDFDDIRFTDDDGVTELDYWRETYSDSSSATFWVEVQDSLDSDVSIFIYYGSDTVTTTSNGTATFIFFDDFIDNLDSEKWTTIQGSISTDSGNLELISETTPSNRGVIESISTFGSGTALHTSGVLDSGTWGNIHPAGLRVNISGSVSALDWYGQWTQDYCMYHTASASVSSDQSVVLDGTITNWHEYTIEWIPSQAVFRQDDVIQNTFSTNIPSVDMSIRMVEGSQTQGSTWLTDWIFIRNYVENEPTHGSWSDEELNTQWHHDCSNSFGFVYNDQWNINWMTWDIVSGTLSSDGSTLSVSDTSAGTDYHGPVFEYALPEAFYVEDLLNFSAILSADNTVSSYLGYQVVMLGDSNRNPVMFFSFGDGWSGSSQGAYGVSYVYDDGSRSSYGSGYPIIWTSFDGSMALRYNESDGLTGHVEGIGDAVVTTLSEADKTREIKYVAIAAASHDTSPLFSVLVDDITIEYLSRTPVLKPSIDSPDDMELEAGTSGTDITWTIGNFTPVSYNLFRDGGLLVSSAWTGGTEITIDLDNLFPGLYNYTMVVNGAGDVYVSDSVLVTIVDTTAPSLGHPSDIAYEYGSSGNMIVWSISDLYPDNYTITLDDAQVQSANWTAGIVTITIDGLNLGVYDYTIGAFDDYDNFAVDTVIVTVEDTTAPGLTHPSNIVVDFDTPIIEITWQATDLLPESYEIYQNGTLITAGTWQSGSNLTYSRTGLTPGNYEITIVVSDTSGNTATDTVFVTIGEQSLGDLGGFMVIGITIGSITVIVIIGGLACKSRGKGIPGVSDFQYG